MNAATLISTTVQARRELASLVEHTDHHLTPEGLQAHRRQAWESIRARLAAVMPAEPTAPDRQPVIDALAAKTADDLAFQAREWEKVRALLDAGRYLPQIIADADRVRLGAILDNLETMPEVLQDSRPEEVVEFIEGAVWDRLVQVDPAAQRVDVIERTNEPAVAWRTILEGLTATGEIPFDGLVLLHASDRDAYSLLIDGDALAASPQVSGSIPNLVESLERTPVDA